MNGVFNLCVARSWWRRRKGRALKDGGTAGVVHRALRWLALIAKHLLPKNDLADLALWLMYHPEVGTLPCDGWKLKSLPNYAEGEIAALKERLKSARRAIQEKLRIEDITVGDLPQNDKPVPRRVAVHVHSYYSDVKPRIEKALGNIPLPFDLYVSSPSGENACPNRGRDLAPLICQFGRKLSEYDYVAHFHTKKSPHAQAEGDWLGHILSLLLGSPERVAGIFALLEKGYGMVCASDFLKMQEDPTGWQHNLPGAEVLLARAGLSFDLRRDFTPIMYPQGSMFWARGDFVRRFLTLPLTFEDFPEEPIGEDGSFAHALERLPFVLGLGSGLKVARIGNLTHD